jgi:hypothetical protein
MSMRGEPTYEQVSVWKPGHDQHDPLGQATYCLLVFGGQASHAQGQVETNTACMSAVSRCIRCPGVEGEMRLPQSISCCLQADTPLKPASLDQSDINRKFQSSSEGLHMCVDRYVLWG